MAAAASASKQSLFVYRGCDRPLCDNKATLTCSGCRVIYYCSQECQRLAWKTVDAVGSTHKQLCLDTSSSSERVKKIYWESAEVKRSLAEALHFGPSKDLNSFIFRRIQDILERASVVKEDLLPGSAIRKWFVNKTYSLSVRWQAYPQEILAKKSFFDHGSLILKNFGTRPFLHAFHLLSHKGPYSIGQDKMHSLGAGTAIIESLVQEELFPQGTIECIDRRLNQKPWHEGLCSDLSRLGPEGLTQECSPQCSKGPQKSFLPVQYREYKELNRNISHLIAFYPEPGNSDCVLNCMAEQRQLKTVVLCVEMGVESSGSIQLLYFLRQRFKELYRDFPPVFIEKEDQVEADELSRKIPPLSVAFLSRRVSGFPLSPSTPAFESILLKRMTKVFDLLVLTTQKIEGSPILEIQDITEG